MARALAENRWGVGLLKGQQVGRLGIQARQSFFFAFLFPALFLVGLALLHVWLRLQVVHLGYVLSTTSKLQSQLEQANRELKVELASLTAPDRLEEMARLRLGLLEPQKNQVVILP